MQLACIVGRTPELSKLELEALAPILSLRWTSNILQAGIVGLKLEQIDTVLELEEVGSSGWKSQKVYEN